MSGLDAYYDCETDEIVGCKKGTLSYRHEEGHRYFNESFLRAYKPLTAYVNICLLSFMVLESSYDLIRIFAGAMLLLVFVDEIAAWLFAFGLIKPKRE